MVMVDTPVPTPTSDQPGPWEDWADTDAAKKAMVEEDTKRRRELLLTLQTDTAGKRETVKEQRQTVKDEKGRRRGGDGRTELPMGR